MAERPVVGLGDTELSRKIADLPSNSRKEDDSKVKQKNIQPIVADGAVKVKKNGFKTVIHSLVQGDAKSAKHYVVYEVLIPGVRTLAYDMLSKGLQMLVYNTVKTPQRANQNRQYVSYGSFYRQEQQTPKQQQPSVPSRSKDFGELLFDSKAEAEDVLGLMSTIIQDWGSVSISDLCEMTRLPSNFTDCDYGWTDLSRARAVPTRDGFLLELPKPEYLK